MKDLTKEQIFRICNGAQRCCELFTMKSAKNHIMVRVAGNESGWRLFTHAFNAQTKKEFYKAIDKVRGN